MSQCIVPNWNLKHQRQQEVEEEEEEEAEQGNRSSHVLLKPNNIHHLVPMSNYEVAELTWENGQLAMQGFSGLLPTTAPTKPTCRSSDTLESIVHQATCHNNNQKQNFNFLQLHDQKTPANRSSIAASSGGKCRGESSGRLPVAVAAALLKKRARSDSDQCGIQGDGAADRSACACAGATLYRDNDATMVISASHESSPSMKTKTTDGDSASHDGSENRDEDRETRGETGRSTRRSRAAAIHNLSERKRRDRINQKLKTLQKLVPNANKTDKASMLDEVIDYLKQLQAQVQMMSSMRSNMPQMMMMMVPLGMQKHLQMSLLARMGMGFGLGMGMGMGQPLLDINAAAAAAMVHRNASQFHHPSPLPLTAHPTPTFLPPVPFMAPPMIPPPAAAQANPNASSNASVSLPDPSCAFLAQSMNMELYSKMAALYQPQMNRTTKSASSPSPSNNVQDDD